MVVSESVRVGGGRGHGWCGVSAVSAQLSQIGGRPFSAQESLRSGGPQSLDAWLLACFVYEVTVGGFTGVSSLRNAAALPAKLRRDFGKLVLPTRRTLRAFAESPYFQSPYVGTCLFLEEMALKDNFEKDAFFK